MLQKERLDSGRVRVTFRISAAIWAETIALVGEFNEWDAEAHYLRRSRVDGEWSIALDLPPGSSYRFRYLVNGEDWMDDDHADEYVTNAFGGVDSVVRT